MSGEVEQRYWEMEEISGSWHQEICRQVAAFTSLFISLWHGQLLRPGVEDRKQKVDINSEGSV